MFVILEWLLILALWGILLVIVILVAIKLFLQPYNAVCKCKTRLDGKTVLVTGGNRGIGLETAKDLARRGARVIIAARDEKKSIEAVQDIISTTGNSKVEYRVLDLAKFSSILKFADDFNKTVDKLHILINNAGVAGLLYGHTEDGIETMTQINYIGPFLLTTLILDKLIASRPSRIVILSSSSQFINAFDPKDLLGHNRLGTGEKYIRYANTKLLGVLWTRALAKRLPKGVTVNALDPGTVYTSIYDKATGFWAVILPPIVKYMYKTVEQGAVTPIHLSVAPELEGVSGEYFWECKPGRICKQAKDDDLAEAMWNETMSVIKEKVQNKKIINGIQ